MRAPAHCRHYTHTDGTEVRVITESEGVRIASVRLPQSTEPARRVDRATGEPMHAFGEHEHHPLDAPDGLILFGSSKWNRATVDQAAQHVPQAADAIRAAVESLTRAERFRLLRTSAGLLQKEVAQLFGVSQSYVSQMETGTSATSRVYLMALKWCLHTRSQSGAREQPSSKHSQFEHSSI